MLAVECMELDNPVKGRVNFPVPTVYGSEAVYTCETGHVLAGNSSRRCQIDGTWSESHPTCIGEFETLRHSLTPHTPHTLHQEMSIPVSVISTMGLDSVVLGRNA